MNESKTRRLEDDIPRFVFHDINDQKQGAAVATIGDVTRVSQVSVIT
jgi:hypothetical protein